MHYSVFIPIIECYMSYVQGLMQNYSRVGVSLEAASLFLLGKVVYILPSLHPTLALLLVGFSEYDYDDNVSMKVNFYIVLRCYTLGLYVGAFTNKLSSLR
ncbi:hypothetical protein Hanom_Chr01g00017931 [Helianthus anomalus]